MGLSVLIVDDEKVFRNFIADMSLWKKGKFVLAGEARNTDEAMRFLERHEVSAVIMDVSMPGKNGVVLSEMIAGKYPQIAMVAVSSYDDYDYVRQILKNGAQDYILKSRLSEEMLERTLEGIETRIEQISPWEIKKELRCQTVQWLMNNGISPFTSDNSRKVVSLAKVQLRKKYSDAGYNAMMEGIGRIFEDGTTEKMDVLAIPAQQGRFVLINRFYEEVSEAKIREKVENSQMISLDNIRRVYDVTVLMQVCPPFFSDKAMRSFILHKLEEKRDENVMQPAQLSLSIGQQNRLLSAIERMDAEKADELVKEIYEQIAPDKEALYMMVTKELLELLERISVEYQISLDFIPKDFQLYEYAREKSKVRLAANISGLYRNVLREMREKTGNKGYSALTEAAVKYMRAHFHESMSLSDAANAIGTNSSYLSRVFHEETQMTFTEFLNRIRVERAVELMKENVPLKDIVSRCGFKSYGYFLKIFKDYTKKTPKEFSTESKNSR